MQYFKKDIKQILFQVLEFHIVQGGQPSETLSLPPAN